MLNQLTIDTNIPKGVQPKHYGIINMSTNYLDFKRNGDNKQFVPESFMENLGKEAYIFTVDYVETADKYLIRKFHYDNLTINDVQEVYDKCVLELAESQGNIIVKKLSPMLEMVNNSSKSIFHATSINVPPNPEDIVESDIHMSIYVLFAL